MKIKELEEMVKKEDNHTYNQNETGELLRDQNKLLLAMLKKLNKLVNLITEIEDHTGW